MHARTRTVTSLAIVSTALLGLSGCAFLPEQRFSDTATVTDADTVTTIEIDDPEGQVTVHGVADATEISIERTVRYRGERKTGETHRVEGDTLVLDGCGMNCAVDYVLEVPIGIDVEGGTSNGDVELSAVGEVDVDTSNGRIELDGVTGRIDAETSNGRITGRDLTGGGIEAESSNGRIELTLGSPQAVDARTSNGEITLTVPDADYRVDAETSNGDVTVDIADDPQGAVLLKLRSSNGSITVSPASKG